MATTRLDDSKLSVEKKPGYCQVKEDNGAWGVPGQIKKCKVQCLRSTTIVLKNTISMKGGP